jgi:hypothetical protein
MNDLDKELNELKQFIADLKADRAAVKEKEQREAWTKYVSLSVVIIAVFAAIASQWAGKYSSRVLVQLNQATYNQAQASDQWAFFQAKSIKQNLYEASRSQLPKTPNPADTNAVRVAEEFDKKIAKYESEKQKISEDAKAFEKKREEARASADEASAKGTKLGLAISFFSVAIAMASICLVTKRRPLWFLALILALVAMGEMARVWLS